MKKRALPDKVVRFFKAIYLRIFRIHDTPQKIALGLGIGVFFGVMPGTGPVIAFLLAIALKVNRASALLGSISTNTWLSVPVLILAIKIGSAVTGVRHDDIVAGWNSLTGNFSWTKMLHESIYTIVAPVAAGYMIVSICIGILAYSAALLILTLYKRKNTEAPHDND